MNDILATWITKKTEEKGWSLRELGRRAEISHATISNIVSGKSNPTFDFCYRIAKAFGEQPEKLFRLAELLPAKPEPNPGEGDLLMIFRQLPVQQQRFLIASARGLQGKPANGPAVIQEPGQAYTPNPIGPAPEPEEMTDIYADLEQPERQMVYDYLQWRLWEKQRRRNSSSRRNRTPQAKQEEWQQAITHIDLLTAIDEANPPNRAGVILRLAEILQKLKQTEENSQ